MSKESQKNESSLMDDYIRVFGNKPQKITVLRSNPYDLSQPSPLLTVPTYATYGIRNSDFSINSES